MRSLRWRTFAQIIDKRKLSNLLLAGIMTLQMSGLSPLIASQKALAAGTITFGSQFENQTFPSDPNVWTNGQLDNYSEGDYVNFRFQLTASQASGAGTMLVEYDKGTCNFFTSYFDVVSASPAIATITEGAQTNGAQYYTQLLNVNFNTAGTTTVIFTLQLSNTAGDCNGANTAVRLGVPDDKNNTPVDENGDFTNVGAKSLPLAAGNVLENPSITITKSVQGGNAVASDFYFTVSPAINGLTTITIPTGQTSITINEVNPDGVFTITEHGPAGYSFTGGTGTSCTANNATIGTANGVMTATATADNDNPVDAVCNFSNQQQTGSLKVVKDVINDNGGSKTYSDFTFKVNGGESQTFNATSGDDGERTLSLPVGTYSVVEPEANTMGYATSYSNCSNVQVVTGQTVTCTITNNDIAPELTVIKNVVNNFGGNDVASDFTMQVFGTDVSDWEFPGSESGTTVTLDAGSYYVAETFEGNGYTTNLSSDCAGTIALGEKKTCTITNTAKAGKITVVKHVINDNGGTLDADDFGISISGGMPLFGSPFQIDGDKKSYSSSIQANSNLEYSISEEDVEGYAEGEWSCTDNSLGDDLEVLVTLNEGEEVTCTITNDDIAPTLTLFKKFNNAWGTVGDSSDFTFYIGANSVTLGDPYALMPGVIEFSESFLKGWKLVDIEGESCGEATGLGGSISVELGGEYECTFVNEDEPAKLTVTKSVKNDNGGTLEAEDFADYISINGYEGEWNLGDELNLRTDQMYTVAEDLPSDIGYSFEGIECLDTTGELTLVLKSNSFTPYPGQEIDCVVYNDDIAPKVKVYKDIRGDECNSYDFVASYTEGEDNTPVTDEFSLSDSYGYCYLDSSRVSIYESYSDDRYKFYPNAGEVTISEETSEDWMTYITCYYGNEETAFQGYASEVTFEIGLDETVYCYFYNYEKATIDVVKFEDRNKNGEWDEGEPTLDGWDIQATLSASEVDPIVLSDTTVDGKVTFNVVNEFKEADEFDLTISETLKAGWEQTVIYCDPTEVIEVDDVILERVMDVQLVDEVTGPEVRPGGSYTCYVGNYKQPITEVLSDTIEPPKLSKTGQPIYAVALASAVVIALAAVSSVNRKHN